MQRLCPYARKCTVFEIGAKIIKNDMEKRDSGRLERVVVFVGRVMAEDLSQNHNVTSVDISKDNLDKIRSKKVDKICKDVSDAKILNDVIKDFDLVVGALPGFMGHETMKRVIMAK